MANARRGNKIYIDTTGAITADRTIVCHILFTTSLAEDQIVIRETSSDVDILVIKGATAKKTEQYSFEITPMVFNNGIYIQTLSAGATAVLITTSKGGD